MSLNNQGYFFKLKLLQPKFDELYKKYEDKNKSDAFSDQKSIAILNKGKRTKLLNNTILGYDVGIQDEGEDTLALGNKILGKPQFIKKIEIIGRDKIEQHGEKSTASIENKSGKESFLSRFFWQFIIPILVIIIAALFLYFKFGIK
jgi:hypothetical protein